jgi:hypothetical protein
VSISLSAFSLSSISAIQQTDYPFLETLKALAIFALAIQLRIGYGNNFPIYPASVGRTTALPLAYVVSLHRASGRLVAHPDRLV